MKNEAFMRDAEKTDFDKCLQNRELSWLKFNERVLEEANFRANPLSERLKFIAIFCSNLDEFYMVRVGSLTDYMLLVPGYTDTNTGMTAKQQLDAILDKTASICVLKDGIFHDVMYEFGTHGVHHLKMGDLSPIEVKTVERHFTRNIMPLLSPQIIDNRNPFPHMENKLLHVAVTLERKNRSLYGLIAVPKTLDRLFFLEGKCRFVLLEDIICHFSHQAFKPYKVLDRTILAVTRSTDIDTEQEDALDENVDYRQFMKKLIKKRQRLAPVRLEMQHEASLTFRAFFCEKLKLEEEQIFLSHTPLELSYYFKLDEKLKTEGWKSLFAQAHVPVDTFPVDKNVIITKEVQKKDILLSYPYESILPFLEMIRQAAEDPSVLSIKITLYRLDSKSRLADSLIRAAENGKEVIVLMELRARFDEENNIEWSHRLEEAGCKVIHGLSGFKVHSKICLITKREFGRIQYITQIGTGNYNEKTAKLYTDLSLITANQGIGEDAAAFFKNMLLDEISEDYAYLWVAPANLKQSIIKGIEQEQEKALNGEEGEIIIKCNSLTDKEIIVKLIEASQAGVKISLIVRGICCLTPGIPEYTHNIKIISVIGVFLEHSRIFCFGKGDGRSVYISSADLMSRNTERRIEIACPVLDMDLKQRIFEMLEAILLDNTKAWEQFSDALYILRRAPSDLVINSQVMFIKQAHVQYNQAVSSSSGNRQLDLGEKQISIIDYAKDKLSELFQSFRGLV